ncbi:PrsW family intramembrane metalloprotease [Orenia marismortui]|uniref:Protease PrsW n=1 Tax=Orenia marismortui TaxID=46469 RepID=A0A4R8GSH9_9FIRM|nr:PrsW family glutamic-type intramembrane protease [Orenia marismortui]TDX48910.1 RsiW-degrading membrane proteinase PrsW (M82 family) [Orenia marismortui]
MNIFWLLFVSLLPGLLWVYFFYRKDRYEPEPAALVLKAFIYGALAVVPVGFIETPFARSISNPSNLFILLLLTIGVIGIVEEFAKFAVIRYTIYNSEEFDEPVDGIIYSVSAGLGFAALENLLYTYVFGFQVGLIRAVITSLVHASFSGIMGYYLGKAKIEKQPSLIYKGLILVIILHGVYDFLIMSGLVSNYIVYSMVGLFYVYLIMLINRAVEASPFK